MKKEDILEVLQHMEIRIENDGFDFDGTSGKKYLRLYFKEKPNKKELVSEQLILDK